MPAIYTQILLWCTKQLQTHDADCPMRGRTETIELNAPGGMEDYCQRYGRGLKQIAANPATPDIFDAANVARVTAAWGPALAPGAQAKKMRWRDRRLAVQKKAQA